MIDDFFTISRLTVEEAEQMSNVTATPAKSLMASALGAYAEEGLLGSSEKDVFNGRKAKLAGVEVDTSAAATGRGIATVASPAEKRMALSDITLDVLNLPATTDALHVCLLGAWTSAALYRRPVLACLDSAYSLTSSRDIDPRILLFCLSRGVWPKNCFCSRALPPWRRRIWRRRT